MGSAEGAAGERERDNLRDRNGASEEESPGAGLLQQSAEAGKVVLVVLVDTDPVNEVHKVHVRGPLCLEVEYQESLSSTSCPPLNWLTHH